MLFIIDRLEDKMAVIEYEGGTFSMPRSLLPPEAAEGQVLRIKITVDREVTASRRQKIGELMDELFKDEA